VFEQAGRLIMWWPKLMQQCAIVGPPAAFRVPINTGSKLRPCPCRGAETRGYRLMPGNWVTTAVDTKVIQPPFGRARGRRRRSRRGAPS
jgi:hypothetical protein